MYQVLPGTLVSPPIESRLSCVKKNRTLEFFSLVGFLFVIQKQGMQTLTNSIGRESQKTFSQKNIFISPFFCFCYPLKLIELKPKNV